MTGRDNSLFIALESLGIRQVLGRSEASAVYMADAYARMRGRPAFVYGAYGPGAANIAGALAEPLWSSSPVIALVSVMGRGERHRREYQELDQMPLFASVTKWGAEVSVAAQVPRFIREAARQSIMGTPGPVYLGIPSDVFEEEVPGYAEPEAPKEATSLARPRPAPSDADATEALRALTGASRPVILAGNGIHHSGAYAPLLEVAERLGIPIATSSAGKGSLPETHDLALGTVGRYSRDYANAAVRDADVILAIGTQLGGQVTNAYSLVSPNAKLIHVTVDGGSIGLNFRTHLGVVADARTFLEALLAVCDREDAKASSGATEYLQTLTSKRQAWHERRSALAARDGNDARPMRPEAVMTALNEQIDDDMVVIGDTGYAAAWAGTIAELRVAGRNFLRSDGSLGWAFPGALGAQLASPEKRVICVTGDGGFGYHIGELETALRLNLPVVVIVLNNQTLAFEAHVQSLIYGREVPEVNDFSDVDYGKVARAFGVAGVRVSSVAEFTKALADALSRRVPIVIDALIDREAIPPVTRYDKVRVREL